MSIDKPDAVAVRVVCDDVFGWRGEANCDAGVHGPKMNDLERNAMSSRYARSDIALTAPVCLQPHVGGRCIAFHFIR